MVFGINKKILFSPKLIYAEYKKRKLLLRYKGSFLTIGDFVSINNSGIGNYVFLGNNVKLNNSSIGDHSYINSDTIIRNTTIGKFCSISSFVKFGLGYHPTNLISTHPAFYSNNHPFKTYVNNVSFIKKERIFIGNDVWIGENATIMDGVKIGDGAIIATGAIVTKNVLPYEVVGGVPAKHIKFRIDKELIKHFLETKWWDKSESWFEQNYKIFIDIDKFIEYFEINNEK